MPKEHKDFGSESQEELLIDMPVSPPPTDAEMDEMFRQHATKQNLARKLPMLFSVYGNIIRRQGAGRSSIEKVRSVIRQADELNRARNEVLQVVTEDWILVIRLDVANELRDCGIIESLLFAGWNIRLG